MSIWQKYRIRIGLPNDTSMTKALTRYALRILYDIRMDECAYWSSSLNGSETDLPDLCLNLRDDFNIIECDFYNDHNNSFWVEIGGLFDKIDDAGTPAYGMWLFDGDPGIEYRLAGCAHKVKLDSMRLPISWTSTHDLHLFFELPIPQWQALLHCGPSADEIEDAFLSDTDRYMDELFGCTFAVRNLGADYLNPNYADYCPNDPNSVYIGVETCFSDVFSFNSLSSFIGHFEQAAEVMRKRGGAIEANVCPVTRHDDPEGTAVSRLMSDHGFYMAEFESDSNKIFHVEYYQFMA